MANAERGAAHPMEAALAAWRAAERERDEHPFGSVEWMEADRRVDELRHAYHELFESAARQDARRDDPRSSSA